MVLDFIGGWGGRVESPHDGAGRLQRSLQEMPDLSRLYSPWLLNGVKDDGTFVHLPGDIDGIEEVVADSILRGDDGLAMVKTGYTPDLIRMCEGSYRKYSVRVGFDGTGLKNHVHFSLDDPEVNPSGGITPELVADHFRILVQAWEPDYLFVSTKKHRRSIGCKPGQICAGWITYVKDKVPLDETTLRANAIEIIPGDGGRYVQLNGTPTAPDVHQAIIVRQALGY
ncbi:hypothetical protein ACFWB0_15255 [Rhodococcus sp. NPDC060086]|uniref:hypothetical protein n=1 Tax=unclassified Rhodococcus (in: high G+C Gram-positive bacteria) TaxID=192944 RepID=UPI00146F4E13|nr:hypothetical protein [Rhodococcus sp. BL-253-APC-6A1W]NMD97853.1 hypothetical protein [Rhodococcus sp. BL-253-APC-6A1W]